MTDRKIRKRKTHKLVVTITHDNAVSSDAAVAMFREMFCRKNNPFLYYTSSASTEDTGNGYIVSADPAPEDGQ